MKTCFLFDQNINYRQKWEKYIKFTGKRKFIVIDLGSMFGFLAAYQRGRNTQISVGGLFGSNINYRLLKRPALNEKYPG